MMTNQVANQQRIDDKIVSQTNAPIGLFDSGVGGLSVYMHLKELLPNERYIYYADTLNVPYGPRPSDEIQQLSIAAIDWLVSAGCKLIVIACNSASAHALKMVRQKYPHIPIVGLVPALKPAVLNSQSKHVAVLATKATLDGELLNTVIKEYAEPAKVTVSKWFNPELVPWVEAGMPVDSDTATRLKTQLSEFANAQVDYLVLGCTHYPFFRDFVNHEIMVQNLGITVIDSGEAIAERVKSLLPHENTLPITESNGTFNKGSSNKGSSNKGSSNKGSSNKGSSNKGSSQSTSKVTNLDNLSSNAEGINELMIDYAVNKVSNVASQPASSEHSNFSADSNILDNSNISTTLQSDDSAIDNTYSKPQAKLSFYVTDPKADLSQVTKLVKRLIYHDALDLQATDSQATESQATGSQATGSQAIDAVKNKQTVL